MSDDQSAVPAGASPELTGGAGFTFEDRVTSIYLTALIGQSGAPGLRGDRVIGIGLQRAAFGQPMDDLIVSAELDDGSGAGLDLQVKRELTISAAVTNVDFRDVVAKAWATVKRDDFRHGVDRVAAAVGSIADGSKRAAQAVFEWARVSPTVEDFEARFGQGVSNRDHRRVRDAFLVAMKSADDTVTPVELHRLLESFQLITFDLLHEGSTDEANAVNLLRTYLAPADSARADELLVRLCQIARDSSGTAGQFTRSSLIARLRGKFRFSAATAFQADLAKLFDEAGRAIAEIDDSVEGLHIPRPGLTDKVASALTTARFVQISGLPGTGKSVVLRGLVEAAAANGPVIFLKADRLQGASWAGYTSALRLDAPRLVELLAEVGSAGCSTLFIDGLDRVEVEHRAVVNDVLNLLVQDPELAYWRVVASVRDNGLEPLRTWLSPRWLAMRAAVVDVSLLDDAEAEVLAEARPHLRSLLFGAAQLRELTRRPFFLSVLARLPNAGTIATENDLIEAWWRAGGYNAPEHSAGDRQQILLALASEGARTLGRRMSVGSLQSAPIAELKADGVIREVRSGHSVAFCHDIYFEWAFLHLLIDRGDAWPDVLQSVGEPPVLGRTVELLAQLYFSEPPTWGDHLVRLEALGLRSQWTRAWLLGPFGSAGFNDHEVEMAVAAFEGDRPWLVKLAVWLQAEKTRPNPKIVSQAADSDNIQQILRVADQLAWPSDFVAWGRFIDWLVAHKDRIWSAATPDVISVFEVWQQAYADLRNARSRAILNIVVGWLVDIEDRRHGERFSTRDWGPWSEMVGSLDDLERRLRVLVLRAARAYPDLARSYMKRIQTTDDLADAAFKDVLRYSPVLADVVPAELADYVLRQVCGELPNDAEARHADDPHISMFGRSVNFFDWHRLSVKGEGQFPSPTPMQEPFHSLFEAAPAEARRLVVGVCNHAITAWRQLHSLGIDGAARPLPLTLAFPWGDQTFWGNDQVYTWYRGVWGPDIAKSALMALESWALGQLRNGRDLDEVLREVLEGHESVAPLGVAVSLISDTRKATPTGAAIVGSARLWRWDLVRYQHDQSSIPPNTIGLGRFGVDDGVKAVLASNALAFRKWSLRDVAMLFVLSADEPLAEAVRGAIQAFEENPPVDFQEQLEDPGSLADAKRTAQIWSKVGDPATYEMTQTPDGTGIQIAHANPHQKDPDVVAVVERTHAMGEAAGLMLWAKDCFDTNGISSRMGLNQAVARAQRLVRPDLFDKLQDVGTGAMTQSGVAGVAAAVLRFGNLGDDGVAIWARQIIRRAAITVGPADVMPQTLIPDHPCIYAAYGLATLITSGQEADSARASLLMLALHPIEMVSAAALSEAMGCWATDRKFAWAAVELGLRLSVGHRPERISAYGYDHTSNRKAMVAAHEAAIRRLNSRRSDFTLPPVPAAWERIVGPGVTRSGRAQRKIGGPVFRHLAGYLAFALAWRPLASTRLAAWLGGILNPQQGVDWREPTPFLRWDFLPKVLEGIPIAEVLADPDYRPAFVELCSQLLGWTIQKIVPPWADDPQAGRDRYRATDLFEWRRVFGKFLGKVGLHLSAAEVRARFLDPIFALGDEPAFSLLEPLVDITSAAGILDPATIAPSAFGTMEACVERVLAAREWGRARRSGELYEHHLPGLVRDLMFVDHLGLSGATRFANDDWRQFDLIAPFLEKMARTVGSVPIVTRSFLVACERARPYVDPKWFADIALSIVTDHGPPVGWRASLLAGRMASVVQIIAEKAHPLDEAVARTLLRVLDALVDMGDRRAAALEISEIFKDVRVGPSSTKG